MGVESKLFGLTDETIERCETETRGVDHASPGSAGSRCDLDPFLLPCGQAVHNRGMRTEAGVLVRHRWPAGINRGPFEPRRGASISSIALPWIC
jgi:hypothetical protein